MIKTYTFMSALLVLGSSLSQAATFNWEDELCQYQGSYDESLYPEARLQATYDFIRDPHDYVVGEWVFEPEDVAKISLNTLTERYQKQKQHLSAMELVDTPFWQQQKQAALKRLEKSYQHNLLIAQAHLDPMVLLRSPYTKIERCEKYVTALTQDNDQQLKAAWRQLVDKQKKKNGSPKRIEASFIEHLNSADWKAWAQVELIGFGLNNCWIAAQVDEPAPDYTSEFERLFKQVEHVECDEP